VALIVAADDDPDLLMLVRMRLTALGHEVLEAHDGAEALELCLSRRPDLAVLDITMPRLTGLEVLRAVRSTPEIHTLPVILLTALASDDAVAEGIRAGASAYMTKPFKLQDLGNRVAELVGD